ncbi:ParB/RepB/Spo0J family partition protein [Clostridiaceae bacterium]|nr:ParB/RepB/Spo0J family partition protein [Clostridium sp.]NBI72510.1 ParB/RepB/Spo0J family partition protein [Clostridiaceae bacterium]
MSKRTGLGKGLGALFGEEYTDNKTPVVKEEGTPINSDAELNGESAQQAKQEVKVIEVEKEKVINISLIEPNSSQPRKMFDEEQLLELAASIKSYGVLQPVLVKKKEDHYELIAGERRWRAAKLAGLKEIPVIIREYTKQQTMEIALIENVQREDLNPIEEARAYQMLIQEFGLKQEEVAVRVSKNRATVTNSMRLLKLDERVQQMLILNQITGGHARTLLALEDGDQQHQVAMKVMNNRLSVRETEKLVKLLTKPPVQKEEKPEEKDLSIFYQDLEDKLKNVMGTKVVINKKDKNKGRIEIEYYSSAELERIVDLIQSIGQ